MSSSSSEACCELLYPVTLLYFTSKSFTSFLTYLLKELVSCATYAKGFLPQQVEEENWITLFQVHMESSHYNGRKVYEDANVDVFVGSGFYM